MNYINPDILTDIISLVQNFLSFVGAIIAIVIALIIAKFILRINIKIFSIIIIVIAILSSLVLMIARPKMHKTFNFNVIERVIKFNSDGSTSIIETTTTNEVKKK